MAEVAKILSPNQKPLFSPILTAGCSLEESCQAVDFERVQKRCMTDHIVLSYINCSAEIKAVSDIIVTSSNAEKNYK